MVAAVLDMTPEAEIPMLAAVNPWAVLEQAQCTIDGADPLPTLEPDQLADAETWADPLPTLEPDQLVDAETWADLVRCEDLIHTQRKSVKNVV